MKLTIFKKLNNLSLVKIYIRKYQENNKLKINSEGYRFITVDVAHSQVGYDDTFITLRFDKLSTIDRLTCTTPLWGYIMFIYDSTNDEITCNKKTFFGACLSNV